MHLFNIFHATIFIILPVFAIPRLTYPVSSNALPSAPQNGSRSVQVIYEFSKGTWVENLAMRSNGQILATLLSSPEIYQVDPNGANPPVLVHRFTSVLGVLGIVEVVPDTFYVVTGNFSLTTFTSTPGSYSVHKIDINNFVPGHIAPIVTKVADFPEAVFLNGAALLDPTAGYIIIADSGLGAVWRLDINTGHVVKVIQDATMAPTSFPAIGINGLKVRDKDLYFTNTNTASVVRIPISSGGRAAGGASIVVSNATGADDFIFNEKGVGFHALGTSNELGKLSFNASRIEILVGSPSDFSTLAGPTACQFGRGSGDEKSLYISSTGGIEGYIGGKFTVGGRISRVSV